METGTLKELNVQPGDVAKSLNQAFKDCEPFTCVQIEPDEPYMGQHSMCAPGYGVGIFGDDNGYPWAIVSRAASRPVGRQIVPGIYNRLGVGERSGDRIWVGLVENDGDYDLGSLLDAKQLRALAATATELADALEATAT